MYNKTLDIFIKVADCGSFSKASEELFISTTAIMKQMNSLEREMGLKLINRTNHGIMLTEAGENIYRHAKYMIEYSRNTIDETKNLVAKKSYQIRIGTSIINPCKPLMNCWHDISDKYPEYKLKIIPFDDNSETVLSTINSIGDKYDFIVAACDAKGWLANNNFYQLGYYRFTITISKSHPLANYKKISLQELEGHTLMVMKPGDSVVNTKLRKEIEHDYPAIQIVDAPFYYDMETFNQVEQNNYALLSLEYWKDIHPSLVTIFLDTEIKMPYGLLYSKNASEEALGFLKAIQNNKK